MSYFCYVRVATHFSVTCGALRFKDYAKIILYWNIVYNFEILYIIQYGRSSIVKYWHDVNILLFLFMVLCLSSIELLCVDQRFGNRILDFITFGKVEMSPYKRKIKTLCLKSSIIHSTSVYLFCVQGQCWRINHL